jgi:hypothetical protein
MTREEGGHTAVLQYTDCIGYTYCTAISGKCGIDTQKVFPEPALIFENRNWYISLLEYGLKFGKNFFFWFLLKNSIKFMTKKKKV